jgi:hypothetical protein
MVGKEKEGEGGKQGRQKRKADHVPTLGWIQQLQRSDTPLFDSIA